MTTPHDEQVRPMFQAQIDEWFKRASVCIAACAGMKAPVEDIAKLRMAPSISVLLELEQDCIELRSKNDALLCMIRESQCPSYDKLRADKQTLVDALKAIQRQDLEDCGIADDDIRMADLWRSEVYVLAREALEKVKESENELR